MWFYLTVKVEGAKGMAGTGIWPYDIGKTLLSRHGSVNIGDKIISSLCRDYLSVLYMPFIPLGLCAGASTDHWIPDLDFGFLSMRRDKLRIPLTPDNAERLVDYVSEGTNLTKPSPIARRFRQSWVLSLLIAVLGGGLGWIAFWVLNLPGVLGAFLGCGLVNKLYIKTLNTYQKYNYN
ncbi:MAG: hypothetical protein ACE5G0_13465 [Rhodothermales bacterium]